MDGFEFSSAFIYFFEGAESSNWMFPSANFDSFRSRFSLHVHAHRISKLQTFRTMQSISGSISQVSGVSIPVAKSVRGATKRFRSTIQMQVTEMQLVRHRFSQFPHQWKKRPKPDKTNENESSDRRPFLAFHIQCCQMIVKNKVLQNFRFLF